MPIEIVRSPNTGVTVSLASHGFLAGHRLALTFDAIKTDSSAYQTLVGEMEFEKEKERLRVEKQTLREVIHLSNHKRRILAKAKESAQKLEDQLSSIELPTWFPDMSDETRSLVRSQLAAFSNYLKSMVRSSEEQGPRI